MKYFLFFILILSGFAICANEDEIEKENINKKAIFNRIVLNMEKNECIFEFIITNNDSKEIKTTDILINNNRLLIIDSKGKKNTFTFNEDPAKQIIIKKGATEKWAFTISEIEKILNSPKKLEKGEYKLIWDFEGTLSNEFFIML